MQNLRVIRPLHPGPPGLSAVIRTQNGTEGTHDETVILVSKPYVHQSLLRTVLVVQPDNFQIGFCILFTAFCEALKMIFKKFSRHATIQLLCPALASVVAMHDQAIMPNDPAVVFIDKEQVEQVRRNRRLDLLPVFPRIIGADNESAGTDRNQSLTSRCNAGEMRSIQTFH